jgi:transcriptional regulator
MYRSELYPTNPRSVEDFVAGQRHGHLIATAPDGHPQVSILPFVKDGDTIELHCVQADPTFVATRANPRVTFFVSDFLAFSPHHWMNPEDAGRATLHFRAVQYSCIATTSTDPNQVAATLQRMLELYEPGAAYRPIENDGFYGGRLRRLGSIRLQIVATEAKFKVGPAGPDAAKLGVAAHLRGRAEPGDLRAADVIEATVRASTDGR